MRHVTAILFVLSLGSYALDAQAVIPGSRVKITSQRYALKDRVGLVLSGAGDSIVVQFKGLNTVHYRQVWADDTLTLARTEIDRFEVSGSSKSHTGHGALIGLSIGAAAGFMVGFASYKECASDSFGCIGAPVSASASGLTGAAPGGLLGAAVGALFGSLARTEKWVTVTPHSAGLSISF
jgi:hypothetical protein